MSVWSLCQHTCLSVCLSPIARLVDCVCPSPILLHFLSAVVACLLGHVTVCVRLLACFLVGVFVCCCLRAVLGVLNMTKSWPPSSIQVGEFGGSFAGNLGEFAMHKGEFGAFTTENLLVISDM